MKKNLGFVLLFVIISSAFLVIPAYFNSDRYKIQSLKADIEIEANGDMVISSVGLFNIPKVIPFPIAISVIKNITQ